MPGRAPRNNTLKHRGITCELRGEILAGRLAPGDRLPTRLELLRRFRTTKTTLQKALSTLKQDGFVSCRTARGTCVVRHPPHLCEYALAFPWPAARDVSQFYRVLRDEARRYQTPARRFSLYYDLMEAQAPDVQRLAAAVAAQRLAGVIFTFNPNALRESPIVAEPGMPRLAIMSGPQPGLRLPFAAPDIKALLPVAMQRARALGRRRVAVIALAEATQDWVSDQVSAAVAASGLETHPEWLQAASIQAPGWAANAALLLLRGPASRRPDVLIITDDNLVPDATAGVAASGLRMPQELLVIAAANFPAPTPAAVPCLRLGYDLRALLRLCVERIDLQRRGAEIPRETLVAPHFDTPAEAVHA